MEEFNSADILKSQNRKRRLVFLEVGLFEISFVLIFIVVIFGTLNYFNILSLSALYPNQLGFLPHQATSSNLNKPNATVPMSTKNPQQFLEDYAKYAKNLDKPTYNSDLKQTVISAIFTGFNQNNLEAETSEGKMTFAVDSNTILQSLIANPNSNAKNGGTLDNGQTYTLDAFANQVPKGSFLQIFYTTNGATLKAVNVNYIPGHKFNK